MQLPAFLPTLPPLWQRSFKTSVRRIGDDIGSTEYVIMLYDIKAAFLSLSFSLFCSLPLPRPLFIFDCLAAYLRGNSMDITLKLPRRIKSCQDGLREGGASIHVRLMSEYRNGGARELRGAR